MSLDKIEKQILKFIEKNLEETIEVDGHIGITMGNLLDTLIKKMDGKEYELFKERVMKTSFQDMTT